MNSMWIKRLKSLLALVMIGEGVVAVLIPRRYALLWLVGPRSVKNVEVWFADHPGVLRVVGIIEAGTGLLLALRQNPRE